MGLLDWLRREPAADEPTDLSRRDFFARVAGRPVATEPVGPARDPAAPEVLHVFHVKGFPFHHGPVLVPIMRTGEEYRLKPDPPYSRSPTGLRIERGNDLLGFLPDSVLPDVMARLHAGEALVCRALRIDPAADLAAILTVEIVKLPPPPETAEELRTESGGESQG